MNCRSLDTSPFQLTRQARGTDFGIGKNNHLPDLALLQQVNHRITLRFFFNFVDDLCDTLSSRITACNLNQLRIFQKA